MTSERLDVAADAALDVEAELAEAEAVEAAALAEAASARARAAASHDGAPARAWRQTAGLVPAALLTGAGLALSGLMVWQHTQVAAERAEDSRFVAAARDGVTALLSIDHATAQADVQRVLDLSTGNFHADFQRSAEDFIKTAVDSKAVTSGSVNAAALDSLDGDRAVVLVAATSKVSNVNGANQDPRPFRMSVTVTREGDACKMSDVEFVP